RLRQWAESHGLDWVEDPSNADTRYTRNAVRERLLPVLDDVLPGLRKRLPASLAALREARQQLQAIEQADLASIEVESGTLGRCLSLSAWRALPVSRRAGVLRRWLACRGCRMASRARVAEVLRQRGPPHADRDVAIRHDGRPLRRHRDLVALVDAPAPVMNEASASEARIELRWEGESR